MNNYLKPIINKLTPEGRTIIDAAVNQAVLQKHGEITPEHVLFALVHHETMLFESLGLHTGLRGDLLYDTLSHELSRMESRHGVSPVFADKLSEWLINSWLLASAQWDRDALDPSVLLGSLFENDTILAPHVQQALNCDRLQAKALLQTYRAGTYGSKGSMTAESSALSKYTRNLSEQARRGELDPVLGRESEIRQMIDILLRRRQNNPILTGEPGVGKTALAEALAMRIADRTVPPMLEDMDVIALDLGALLAGASVKGEFESRLQSLLQGLLHAPKPAILFIDEIHTLIGAGGQIGQSDAANLLKPALARGELRVVGATTWSEYKKYFEKDAALTRRFQVVKVAEPGVENAIVMLRSMVPAMSKHHGVTVLESAIKAAVTLSSRYISGRQLPDKSVSLLDTACARVAISQVHVPKDVEAISVKLCAIHNECDALRCEDSNPERLGKLLEKAAELQIRHDQLHHEWQCQQRLVSRLLNNPDNETLIRDRDELERLHKKQAMVFERVDEICVADVVAEWTGIPLGRILEKEQQMQDVLFGRLAERVIGQQHALTYICQQVRISRSGLGDPLKPTGVFLLAGPSGTGKTETAFALAEYLYGGEHNLLTINMSEYQEAHTVSGLKGAPPGYVGYGQGGILTESIRRNPYSVILLDEVEKAHPDVMELFYQIFDKGLLEDADGQVINFRNALIILTSNLAGELIMKTWNTGECSLDQLDNIIRPEFERIFTPALMGRMTLIPYLPLQQEELEEIIILKLKKFDLRYQQATNDLVSLTWSKRVIHWIAERCQRQQSGARDIDRILQENILPLLATQVLKDIIPGEIQISLLNHKPALKYRH